jgi:acyl-coenzyme A synthetase/AMP-(fatty) acid ligase
MVAEASADLLERVPGCAGIVHPWNKVEIVDDEDRPLPLGAEGNIRIRTPAIVSEYLGAPQDGDGALRGGWFYPGDIGSMTADNVLILMGRANEVINAGGVKVSPDLIAGTLMGFAGIRDAAAFGIEYADRPTEICAAVVTQQPIDAPALLDACRKILLARAPHRIVRVEQIPRNQMGKVIARELRQLVG